MDYNSFKQVDQPDRLDWPRELTTDINNICLLAVDASDHSSIRERQAPKQMDAAKFSRGLRINYTGSYIVAAARTPDAHQARIESPRPSQSNLPFHVGERMPHYELARAAEKHAIRTSTTGWCLRSVAHTLEKFGITLTGRSAYMAASQLKRDGRIQEVSLRDLLPGDILVHGRSSHHQHGHIAIYLGHGKEASDHVQHLVSGSGYGGTRVFRIISGDFPAHQQPHPRRSSTAAMRISRGLTRESASS